jgi:hypothetical protein
MVRKADAIIASSGIRRGRREERGGRKWRKLAEASALRGHAICAVFAPASLLDVLCIPYSRHSRSREATCTISTITKRPTERHVRQPRVSNQFPTSGFA